MVDAIAAALPVLLRARLLDATGRAQRAHGRPVTSAEILQAFDVPLARSTKGLTVLLAKVATLAPDESGRRLLDLGKDRTGTRTFLVDEPRPVAAHPSTPVPAPVAPASIPALLVPPELAERLHRLAGGQLGATQLDVLEALIGAAEAVPSATAAPATAATSDLTPAPEAPTVEPAGLFLAPPPARSQLSPLTRQYLERARTRGAVVNPDDPNAFK